MATKYARSQFATEPSRDREAVLNVAGVGRRSGHAIVEASLMVPWIIFLFVGVLDMGFYSYAAISTQNAARVAAMANATGDPSDIAGACQLVVYEMHSLPNAQSLDPASYSCPNASPGSVSDAAPIGVTVLPVTGPDGNQAVKVTVSYLSIPMIPIPGILMGLSLIHI